MTSQSKPAQRANQKPQRDGQPPRDDKRRTGGKAPRGGDKPKADKPRLPPIEVRSVVDRGRGNLSLPAGDGCALDLGDTAWTITKVAKIAPDTKKPEGVEYELAVAAEGVPSRSFSSLAEARDAVGKKIVHPEKATPPKGAAKGPAKGAKK